MSESTKVQGRCLCGAVHYEATPTGSFSTCYCKMCQRWSAGAYFGAPTTQFQITQGEQYLKVFRSSSWAERAFCSQCGSNLYYFSPKYGNNKTVALGSLQQPDGLLLKHQYFIDQKPSGFSLAEDSKKLTTAEIEALFGGE